ncbi:MAG: alanine--tRNA ligase [Anaerolineales bacterium]
MKSPSEMTSTEIRQSFLDFFAAQKHTIVPSASLVPGADETLLFTNAGMVQFKDVFLGTGDRPYVRAVDSQKCMRVAGKHNDLDDVGRDDSHHTFFEMLGNWSFGDYYKEEAISWAWQLLTDVWGLPKDQLWVTCFEDENGEIPRDDEAANNWAKQPGFDSSHILFFGREENFWEMAETGPSGPDSEIHMDLGPEYCNMQDVMGHECRVNGDCTRFLEFWNLVFIQYNRTGPTQLDPLPKKHVDTGMGFERIVSVLQGTQSNYKTDLFAPIIMATQQLAGHSESELEQFWTPYRVIADHSRAASFLIGDGVVPGNLGRNYVTRMIIRRASLFGSKLGFEGPFLAEVARAVIDHYGDAYPELAQSQQSIERLITDEEQRFARTVEGGISRLNERLEQLQGEVLPGEVAFDLYATYGLPFEIARDLARESGKQVEEQGFFDAMNRHRAISTGEGFQTAEDGEASDRYREILETLAENGKQVRYDPYSAFELETPVLALVRDGEAVDTANEGEEVSVVLAETPFYVEAGGQVSDSGTIVGSQWRIEVEDTRRPIEGLVIHIGTIVNGKPRVGDSAVARVDRERRMDIMRNHTATHLLHAALRDVLGAHARQAGSLVAPDRLRFDFTHPKVLTVDEIERIQQKVNEDLLSSYSLLIRHQDREEAIQAGAMALFGETYGDTVRTICIGEPACFSYELCGGTHVENTSVIGTFLITSEGSVASGIRRIEAVTGRGALDLIQGGLSTLDAIAGELGVGASDAHARVVNMLEEQDRLEARLAKLRQALALEQLDRLTPEQVDGIPVLVNLLDGLNADSLRLLIDRFRADNPSGVAVLASTQNGQPIIVAGVTEDLVERGLHAADLVKSVAEVVGGGGGGKPTLAQAGGKDASKLPEALARVPAWVEAHLT